MTTVVSQLPSAHTQRYDRQLRLWASSGQASLEKSHILVIAASSLSAQILKNLVLPGIGAFTILDDATVNSADLGVNFFLQPGESEGRPAAQEMARLLAEMNDSVGANSKLESPAALLMREPSYFTSFSLIISVNQPHSFDLALSDLCWSQQPPSPPIPMLRVRAAGMMAEMTVSLQQLGIVETHPDSIIDLRLTRPFPELEALAASFDLSTEDTMLRSHTPFVVILLQKLKEWKDKHGSLPTTANRAEFTALVNAARRADNADEENFDEAISALGKHVWRPIASEGAGGGGVPPEVADLFKATECEKLGPNTTNFWLLVRALRDFVAASPTHSLPLSGSLPDMKATSEIYVRLQSVYRAKASVDLADFSRILDDVVAQAGVAPGSIGSDEVQAFVKHAGYLKLVRGRSERQRSESPNAEATMMAFMDPINPCTFQHHLAFLAADKFYEHHGRYPGSSHSFSRSVTSRAPTSSSSSTPTRPAYTRNETDETRNAKRHKSETPTGDGEVEGGDVKMRDGERVGTLDRKGGEGEEEEVPPVETDEAMLLELLKKEVIPRFVGAEATLLDEENWEKVEDAVGEMVRSGHASLPATSALMGGIVAQETIKLITRQYVPADNTVVYDGVKQAVGVFRL